MTYGVRECARQTRALRLSPRASAGSSTYAYVADEDNGLQIIDIGTPTAPFRVGGYDTPDWANAVAVAEKVAQRRFGSGFSRDESTLVSLPDPAS